MEVFSDLKSGMKHELTPHPSTLFHDCGMMRRGNKLTILKGDVFAPNKLSIPATNIRYIIDGGSLLQWLQWDSGKSFGDICNNYVEYVRKNCMNPVIVFDGHVTPPKIMFL